MKRTNHRRLGLAALCVLGLSAVAATGDVIAGYLDGTSGLATMPPFSSHSRVSASEVDNTAFTSGPVRDNWTGADLDGYRLVSGHNKTNPADIGENATDAEVVAAFGYRWTMTADPGMQINLSSITLDFGIVAAADSPPADWGYRVFVDIDGSGFVSIGSEEVFDALAALSFAEKDSGDFAVSGSTSNGGTVTIKLVDWGKIAGSEQQYGSSANTFQNIIINGTVGPAGPSAGGVSVDSVKYNPVGESFSIVYDTSFPSGVDVYYSTDLVDWVADGSEAAVGSGLELERASSSPARFYLLVEPGRDP